MEFTFLSSRGFLGSLSVHVEAYMIPLEVAAAAGDMKQNKGLKITV